MWCSWRGGCSWPISSRCRPATCHCSGWPPFASGRELEDATLDRFPRMRSGFEQPVTIVVPAYNETANIAASLRSLLQLEYPAYEIIVVNDGSTDGTLETLIREFALVPFPEAYRLRLPVKPIRGVYRASGTPESSSPGQGERRQGRRPQCRGQRGPLSAVLQPGRRFDPAARQPRPHRQAVPRRSHRHRRRRHRAAGQRLSGARWIPHPRPDCR